MSAIPFPIEKRFYRYSTYLKQTFGERVYRIALDAGFTCPTRDGTLGTDGCLYCNNASFTAESRESLKPVREQLSAGIQRARKYRKANKFLAYFQAYTNTYAPLAQLEKLYRSVLDTPDVVGILIGTRPDCVDNQILSLLSDINQQTYISIEYGIESVYDKTLKWAKRGHDFTTTQKSIAATKDFGIHVGGHIIFGFPTESRMEILESAAILNRLDLDALKIHHLQVVKGSQLAQLYQANPFSLYDKSDWINLACDFLERLDPKIVIQRLVSDARAGTLIAPIWTCSKIDMLENIRRELTRRETYQGFLINQKNPGNN
jgi:radical SAM protein (TIGR01212 family)